MSFWLMALRAFGRLSVTVATFCATSTVKHSYPAYPGIYSSLIIGPRRRRFAGDARITLAAHARLHLGHRDTKRHRARILLQHPLNGFQMSAHQPRRRGNITR